jgi:hypothetical protein
MIKVNVKLSLCLTKHHAMKAYWGSGGIAPSKSWGISTTFCSFSSSLLSISKSSAHFLSLLINHLPDLHHIILFLLKISVICVWEVLISYLNCRVSSFSCYSFVCAYKISVEKPQANGTLRAPCSITEDNIRMDNNGIGRLLWKRWRA